MSVDTDCALIVVGPQSDIDAMETGLTSESRAAVGVPPVEPWSWDTQRGWPSTRVVQRNRPESGLVLYNFDVRRMHPGGWIERQAVKWPRLEFRAHYAIDLDFVARQWLTASDDLQFEIEYLRSEWLYDGLALTFSKSGGWWRWLEEAGFPKQDHDRATPVEIWCEPWLAEQLKRYSGDRTL